MSTHTVNLLLDKKTNAQLTSRGKSSILV